MAAFLEELYRVSKKILFWLRPLERLFEVTPEALIVLFLERLINGFSVLL
jgi:hypothetical protein